MSPASFFDGSPLHENSLRRPHVQKPSMQRVKVIPIQLTCQWPMQEAVLRPLHSSVADT